VLQVPCNTEPVYLELFAVQETRKRLSDLELKFKALQEENNKVQREQQTTIKTCQVCFLYFLFAYCLTFFVLESIILLQLV
jgi:hypothetical protein